MKTSLRYGFSRQGTRSTAGLQRLLVISVWVFGASGYAFSQRALSVLLPPPALTVVVDNYSRASTADLARAEREADRIFGRAGLGVMWLNCSSGQRTVDTQQSCHRPIEVTDVRLRILPAPVVNKFQNTVFGFVIHPVLASVYYESALRLAKIDDAEFELPIILGSAIVHEIGHLLLGPNSHSADGIMRPKWERKQVEQARWGSLLFTSEQSKVLRAEVQRRTLTSTAGLP